MITHPENVAAAVTPRRVPDAAPCVHALAPTVLLTPEAQVSLLMQVASKPATRAPLVATAIGGWAVVVALLGALVLGGCNGPRVVHESPVLVTGERVPLTDSVAAAAGARILATQLATAETRDSITAIATAGCAPDVCAALARGEVTLGMTEAQVLAATRTTPAAWRARRSGPVTTLSAPSLQAAPSDAAGEIAMVQLADGRVGAIGYREPQGVRLVQRAEDATRVGRARATADALVREGDAMVAAGDRTAALDRYDRALVLLPDDAMLQYRIATLLDQQLRPVEALIRYQRFLQQLELQRIDAIGNAHAKLADAIARAQQRIIVLERQAR
ncbi:hypothetical protein [Roseisolibacter agri]|uniref:Tetratricopeptide repeat protein n=1 Tax=Roseisolibacter agri TaxID=2014610 RepID=A0AA37QJY0_9BACT|nr:hypothetical protein [Roseisolibacter agri]GLC27885.1 hypothetical protein rosag_43980 [Roseisolibacter agri]